MAMMTSDFSVAVGPRAVAIEYRKGKVGAVILGHSGVAEIHHSCGSLTCEHEEVLRDLAGRYLHPTSIVVAGGDLSSEEAKALHLERDLTPEVRGEMGIFTTLEIGRVSATAGTWDEYLRSQDVPEAIIAMVAGFRSTHGVGKVRPPRTEFHGPAAVRTAVTALLLGQSLNFKGPKATGKTLLVEQLAWVFGRPLVEVAGNVDTQRGDLTGERTLDLQDGQPIVTFEFGLLAEAMRDGKFLLMDEVNTIRPEVLVLLHPVLDGRNRIDIPGVGTVEAHPAFRAMATMNYGYMGTQETNEATADRMLAVRLDDAPVASILERETGLDKSVALKLQTLFETLQSKLQQGNLLDSRAVTLRGLLQAAGLIVKGLPIDMAVRAGVVDKVDDDEARLLVTDTAVQVGLLADRG